jgi:hypothetical protein
MILNEGLLQRASHSYKKQLRATFANLLRPIVGGTFREIAVSPINAQFRIAPPKT